MSASTILIASGAMNGCACGVTYDDALQPQCRSCGASGVLFDKLGTPWERYNCHVCVVCVQAWIDASQAAIKSAKRGDSRPGVALMNRVVAKGCFTG